MKRIKSRKGFTLTETLIGIVVLMILAGVASSIMLSCFGIYGRTAKRNSAQSIGDTVYELIYSRMTYAVDLTVTNDVGLLKSRYNVIEDGNSCIFVPPDGDFAGYGVGTLAPPSVITVKQLQTMKLIVSVESSGGSLAEVTVTVNNADDGRQLYSRTGTVHLMNADNSALGSFCDVQNCDSSDSGLFIVFSEPA